MAIKVQTIDGIGVLTPDGAFSIDEAKACLVELFTDHPVKHTIWDLTEADLSFFAATDFLEISKTGDRFTDVRGPGARAALVGKSTFDRLLLKAFTAFANQSIERQLGIFETLDEAFDWLQA